MFGRIRREFAKYHRLETKDGVPLRWFEWKNKDRYNKLV